MDHVSENKHGFTLIELAIAILIFALGIMGVAKMQSEAVRGASFSMQMTEAISVAEDQLAVLTSQSLKPSVPADLQSGQHNGTAVLYHGVGYTPTWNVTTFGTGLSRQVAVTVSWTDREDPHSVTINSIMGQED